MSLLDDLGADLSARDVRYALIGAAALAARGVGRSTFDIDILVVDHAVLDDAFWAPWRAQGVEVDVRRGDGDDPLAGVVRVRPSEGRPVDVIVGRHAWQARALERADQPPGGPPIVTAVDLVLLKLYAGGTQDAWDIRALLALPDGATLAAAVERELETLPPTMTRHWRSLYADR